MKEKVDLGFSFGFKDTLAFETGKIGFEHIPFIGIGASSAPTASIKSTIPTRTFDIFPNAEFL